ncbi:MAG: hypothetical protein DI568_15315 [Sphingomonas sp.]|nr:MAG: hypothetical protein DI568_15315 [Sphingomonas sp.]
MQPGSTFEVVREDTEEMLAVIARLLRGGQRSVILAIGLILIGALIVAAGIYLGWFVWLPALWNWGADSLINRAASIFGALFLLALPLYGFMAFNEAGRMMAGVRFDEAKAARKDLQGIEDETIRALEGTDIQTLLLLLRYSRAQLDAYYAMGLQQTQGSYRNAIIAMWLGFAILLTGIFSYIVPVELSWLREPSGNFALIILSSAVIIEVVAALFLWTYRSTVGQLTFYYQLQMRNHAAIQSFAIANTMQKPDSAKRAVIDAALGTGPTPERLDLPTAKGLTEFVKAG